MLSSSSGTIAILNVSSNGWLNSRPEAVYQTLTTVACNLILPSSQEPSEMHFPLYATRISLSPISILGRKYPPVKKSRVHVHMNEWIAPLIWSTFILANRSIDLAQIWEKRLASGQRARRSSTSSAIMWKVLLTAAITLLDKGRG